jgi:hypothetical protein
VFDVISVFSNGFLDCNKVRIDFPVWSTGSIVLGF